MKEDSLMGAEHAQMSASRFAQKIAFPFFAAVSSAPVVYAQTPIASVTTLCDTCVTYQDLAAHALRVAPSIGVGVKPQGFPTGYVSQPGYTKILVTSKKAPISFAFDYSATKGTIGSFLSQVTYYTYAVTPISGFPATTGGAVSQDRELYKASRVSGLPVVELPARDSAGTSLSLTDTSSVDSLQRYISANVLPLVPGSISQRTLPGMLNWSLLPSIKVVYQGKTYTLYDGDSFVVKDVHGTTAEFKVQVSSALLTVGYAVMKTETVKPGPNTSSTAPTPAPGSFSTGSLNALNPATLTFDGSVLIINVNPTLPVRTPSVTIYQWNGYWWDFYDIG